MKDVAADASEIDKIVATLAKADTAKTPETVDTADIAFAHGPWLPLPVTDVSDVLDISVAAPQLAPDSIYRTSVTALPAPPTPLLPTLTRA